MPDVKTMQVAEKTGKFPIVAVGGAGGSLEAMQELLQHLPVNTGMAYVYIQHSDPNDDIIAAALLANSTRMNVLEVKNALVIQPDHLYVIPPGKGFDINNGAFSATPRTRGAAGNMPVNHFFRALAEQYQETTIGIVLSGDTSDGATGLKDIKIAGGLTFAQDQTARFQNMPKNAVTAGGVDLILAPRDIASELSKIGEQKDLYYLAIQDLTEESISNRDEHLISILHLLNKSTGVDFSQYKMSTIKRRIIRRMMLYKLETLKEYAQYIREHANEANILHQDLLINVTSFFRDAEAGEYLKENIVPRLIQGKSFNDPIRIWIPACSSGQEAYSLAMLLMEVLGEKAANTPIQLFATDISEMVINKARLGVYTQEDVRDITPRRLQRFFTKMDGHYRIIKGIRDLCVFATHNLFKDPPFSRLDMISCCNLMIYLDSTLQKKIISTFHYSLMSNGYLILGKSETVGTSSHLFTQMDKKVKIYARKKDTSAKALFEMNYRVPESEKTDAYFNKNKTQPKNKTEEVDLERMADKLLLSKYTPASVIINQDLDILQFRGSTGLFLEPSPGKASLNLLKMARTGLGFELRNIIHKAKKSREAVKKSGLEIAYDGKSHKVAIEAVPIHTVTDEQYFLIIFEQIPQPTADQYTTSVKDRHVKQLEMELSALREDMRAIVEGQETANEELQSANEEIVSSNEELQSINEELETSKEEIESSNEELITINQELQVRNEQLAETQEYSEAVFTTIRESLLILDKNLRIKSANNAFYKCFMTTEEETIGRFLFELGNRQWDIPRLRELLENTLQKHTYFNNFEITHHFPGIGEKAMLLNARKLVRKIHNEELILLAIEDITEHNQARKIMQNKESWFRNMADTAPVMIWVSGPNRLVSFFNKTWLEYTGAMLEASIGKMWTEGVHPDDLEYCTTTYNLSFAEKKPFMIEYRMRRMDGEYRWMLNKARPGFTEDDKFTGYIGCCVEIHDQRLIKKELEKRVQERTNALQESNADLERSNSELQQFAYVASHDLQEPLRKIILFIDTLQERFPDMLNEGSRLYMDKIIDSSKRMTRLIDDLLNFARISKQGKKFLHTDLNDVLQNVLTDLDMQITEKRATLQIEKLPVIEGIPLQMTQLFYNLLTNALKFSDPAIDPVISITITRPAPDTLQQFDHLDKNLSYCEIVCKDNGIGFLQKYADQIFIIFQRLADKQHYPGTGIGLSLCKRIVHNHNGEIFAISQEGKGAAFHILLPEKQSEHSIKSNG